jgi:Transcriptional regulators
MTAGKSKQAYEIIKNKIFEGIYPPQSDISEDVLQQELGISRTPIHEALQKLNEEGFVNIYPRKGTIVTDLSLDKIYWIYEARELNEPFITRHSYDRISAKWLMRMKEEFQKFPTSPLASTDHNTRQHFIELDYELHNMIVSTCRNDFLREMMSNVNDHSQRLRIRVSRLNREYECSVNEHLDIINALLDRSPDDAEQAAIAHIRAAKAKAFDYY